MGKLEKKRKRLKERIECLEYDLTHSLKQKTSDTKEVDLGSALAEIEKLKREFIALG